MELLNMGGERTSHVIKDIDMYIRGGWESFEISSTRVEEMSDEPLSKKTINICKDEKWKALEDGSEL
jgi:hypothetical protein